MTDHEQFMNELRKWERPDYPQWVYDLFPLWFIFYRPTKPRKRKGTKKGQRKKNGKIIDVYHTPSMVVANQNYYSYLCSIAKTPGEYITIVRTAKHRGFSTLIGALYATEEDIKNFASGWRHYFCKYKTLREFYNLRGVADSELENLFKRLDGMHPSLTNDEQQRLDLFFPQKENDLPFDLMELS